MVSADLENIAIANLLDSYLPKINKYAFGLEDVYEYGVKALNSLEGAITDVIHNLWDPEHPVASFAGMALDVAVMSVFGPFGSILIDACMDIFGISFKDIILKVQSSLASLMQSNGGTPPSDSQIDAAVNSATGGANEANDHITSESYLEIERGLKKIASKARLLAIQNSVNGQKKSFAGLWSMIFGGAAKGASKSTFGAFFKKIISTIFKLFFTKTAGKFVANVAQKAVGLAPKSNQMAENQISLPPAGKAVTLKEVNWGHESQTTKDNIWVLPVSESRIEPLFIGWATTIYPELKGHEDLITSAKSFNDLVSAVQDYSDTADFAATYMPRQLTSKYDVVSRFISEVDSAYAKAIKEPTKN